MTVLNATDSQKVNKIKLNYTLKIISESVAILKQNRNNQIIQK